MPPTGSTFTDWQQVEKESRLLMDEDFSWSEPPQRRRRPITDGQPIRARRTTVVEYDPQPVAAPAFDEYELVEEDAAYAAYAQAQTAEAWDHPTQVHSHFDEMMEEWTAAYSDSPPAERAFDLSDPGSTVAASSTRRTVVINGRGDDRYMPAPRRRRGSELRFHERSGFSPDRAGLWAVLLGIALVIGAIAH